MEKIELNQQFVAALELMNDSTTNVFITGKAGTGKSTLLTYFREHTKLQVTVLAPTGVAAVNVRGQTIHSFFGFKPDITVETVQRDYKHRNKKGLFKKLEAIVIDEISVVRADLLDCVDTLLKMHGKNPGVAFGGVKMIFIGDLYQLPPVVTGEERALFRSYYPSPYFFDAKVMVESTFVMLELEKIYRQKDDAFIRLLNGVRNRSISEADMMVLNARHLPEFEPPEDDFYIHLTTTNALAEAENQRQLNKLAGKLHLFEGEITGKFEMKSLPTAMNLEMKIGAQVMLVNNDREGKWVNGTVGKIVDIAFDEEMEAEVVWVEVAGGEIVEVVPHTWEMFKFFYNEKANKLDTETVGSFTQYPLILAWAVTIHKSQGKTFDKVIIDWGGGTFAHGQSYVALSRCRSLEGIVLKKPFLARHILMDWRVVKWLTGFQYKQADKRMSFEDKLELIRRAIETGQVVDMVYLKANDEKSRRKVRPEFVGEMEYNGVTYLGMEGYCMVRQDARVFRVDRILELKVEQYVGK